MPAMTVKRAPGIALATASVIAGVLHVGKNLI